MLTVLTDTKGEAKASPALVAVLFFYGRFLYKEDVDMRLVDRVTCVHCGSVKFQRATGKGSRSFFGECEPSCEKEIKHGVSEVDVPQAVAPVVSEGRKR